MGSSIPADAAARIRRVRTRIGLSQVQFATLLGVSNVTVNRWEHGRTHPSLKVWRRIDQAEVDGLAALSGNPPAIATARSDNLPLPLTTFVGRKREIADLSAVLAHARLLTLTGPGGSGKTRLAAELARSHVHDFPNGRWLADLAKVVNPALVPDTVASALGIGESTTQPLVDRIVAFCQLRRLLLILDNCEHLRDACAGLAATLLPASPGLRILATSRAELGLSGETIWPLPPLSLPEPDSAASSQSVARSEAVLLFVERARSRHPAFRLTNHNAAAVAEVCRRLDGLPLAIELAAAQIPMLTPAQVLDRLHDRFQLLRDEHPHIEARHQTLEALIVGSANLLDPTERALFARLSVFAGSFDLAAAEAIAGHGTWGMGHGEDTPPCSIPPPPSPNVLDLLGRLVAQSLVTVEAHEINDGATARYRLLESLRAYAHEQLLATGEADVVATRHASYFLALAESAEANLHGPDQLAWLERLEREHDNLLAALARSVRAPDADETGLRLAAALGPFWETRGHFHEGSNWLTRILAQAAVRPSPARAKALNAAGRLAAGQGLLSDAMMLQEEALAAWQALDDQRGVAVSLTNLGIIWRDRGENTRAAELQAQALARYRQVNDRRGMALALNALATAAHTIGNYAEAAPSYAESLALYRAIGDRRGESIVLNNLGAMANSQGDHARAVSLQEQNLALARELGDQQGIAMALGNLGEAWQHLGDLDRAARRYRETLPLFRELGDSRGIATSLGNLGMVAVKCGDHESGVRLLGAAASLRAATGTPRDLVDRAEADRCLAIARERLGDETFERTWSIGHTLSVDEALAAAGPDPDRDPVRRDGAELAHRPLTERQLRILRLIASGCGNRDVADALAISPRTVDRHLTAIYTALGVANRTSAVAAALRLGLLGHAPSV